MNLREAAKKLRDIDHRITDRNEREIYIREVLIAVCERLAEIAPAADRHEETVDYGPHHETCDE